MGKISADTLSDGTTDVSMGYPVNGSAKALCRSNVDMSTTGLTLNVSSIVDDGTGQLTINFTNSFNDAAEMVHVASTGASVIGAGFAYNRSNIGTAQSVNFYDQSASVADARAEHVTFGDLA